ncbi:GNAT family N-acetyltransferase [Flavobacterium yafengii]|jgi:ribosomal protein S18 acetylase RimI-like enzyme|uniref:GNAT family N-acetyltransferase n=1 Tax=Flavobacterium yafengii TaxID=3041253 RepID=UPI0024A83EEA|nr:GNAT family N-acetyltransferase [Flavobacterium yafengii]MDI5896840.1 GNAT family N-acetyltransferase [Flavobacterium yafengii]
MIQFKPLAIADIETIVKLMQEFYAIDNYPIDIDVSKALFREFISNENLGKSWLIVSDTEIVGYVILTFVFSFEYQGKIAFLDELYLTEKTRGKGIGSKTIEFIQNESHKLSLKLVYLEVEQHNEKAQKLYLAHDFELHNRKMMRYKIR